MKMQHAPDQTEVYKARYFQWVLSGDYSADGKDQAYYTLGYGYHFDYGPDGCLTISRSGEYEWLSLENMKRIQETGHQLVRFDTKADVYDFVKSAGLNNRYDDDWGN
jgi:hypothetical protein